MTFCNSFYARVYGYLALLTDDYPPIGIEKAKGVGNLGGGLRAAAGAARRADRLTRQEPGKGGRTMSDETNDRVERGEGWASPTSPTSARGRASARSAARWG